MLLVGGASRRFGSPKALARLGDETLAERAWRTLGAVCAERFAVGKAVDGLPLPFPVHDDGSAIRAPLAGLVAGLRLARHDVCVVLPVDTPLVSAETLQTLAGACIDAAVPQTGPLPGAYRRSAALAVLEHRLARGALALRDALDELTFARVDLDESLLANVNTVEDLAELARRRRSATLAGVDRWLEQARDAIAAAAGRDPASLELDEAGTATLLDLARIAAHESGDRTNAPLLCYLVGRAQGDGSLEGLAAAVRRMA